MSNLLKNFGMAMVAILMIIGFSAFKVAEKDNDSKTESPILVYFHGDPLVSTEVQDPELWKVLPYTHTCNTGNNKACSMEVDEDDLTGVSNARYLDPTKITIDAVDTANGFIPDEIHGSSSPNPQIFNRF